jgi:hypothetical protein
VPSLSDEQNEIAKSILGEGNQHSILRMPVPLATLFRLQHYGTPTRICDLTISNLCALFFASDGVEDGAVFVIDDKSAINSDSSEMQIFSKILTGNYNIATLQNEAGESVDIENILTRNYVVKHREMLFNNSRSYRQGGTGIVFGFDYKNGELGLLGDMDVSDLIIAKIIIPKKIKKKIGVALRNLGYTKEVLYDTSEGYQLEDVSLVRVDFNVNKKHDKGEDFYKIEGKYKVSTLYFDPDILAVKISNLYEGLFARYGSNARIWTFYYFDDNDFSALRSNWVCHGLWDKIDGFKIKWNKQYFSQRLHTLNIEVSKNEAIGLALSLVDAITPIYEKITTYTSTPDYELKGLFQLLLSLQSETSNIRRKADDFPYVDFETQKFTEKAISFVYDVILLIDDMIIFSKRTNMNEASIKWMIERDYYERCDKSQREYILARR